jgi:protein-S-isoprenylcysteine O-methyltransferase Ste14
MLLQLGVVGRSWQNCAVPQRSQQKRDSMERPEELRPTAVPWPPLLFVAALGAALMLGRFHPLPWPGLDDVAARIIGYGFGLAGIGLTAWSITTLARAHTNILPNRGADKLVTTGPFRIWRNPLYMGETLIFLGLAQATGNIWMVVAAPLFALGIFVLSILPEERHMEARFGRAYLDYKARTRRWF